MTSTEQNYYRCRVCNTLTVTSLLDLGRQPVSNRFCKSKEEFEFKHQLILGICQNCALVQQIDPYPINELRPKQDWVRYLEPEQHLDAVAELLEQTLRSEKDSSLSPPRICALSYKDASLLERMKQKGFSHMILSPRDDLGVVDNYGGVDLIQQELTVVQTKKIASKHGKFDLIIARHILEHAYYLNEFIVAIRELLTPEGMILFEIPDYARSFETYDYSTLWEEHLLYFTPKTLKQSLASLDLSLIHYRDYFLPLETCLIALVKPNSKLNHKPNSSLPSTDILKIEKQRAEKYAQQFPLVKQHVRDFFFSARGRADITLESGKIAVYGAGHAAVMLINLFELRDCIDFVIDDHPLKKGWFIPGAQLSIVSSTLLLNVSLCAFCLNPETEPKIVQQQREFTNRGGLFVSLTPGSHLYLLLNKNNSPTDFVQKSLEVIQSTNEIIMIERRDLELVRNNATISSKKRSRICFHKSSTDKLHEMLITLNKGCYIRPHRHGQKAESFHIIEGLAYVVIFNDDGIIADVIALGDYHSQRNFYYRIDAPYFHTVVVLSSQLVFHETTTGPFNKEDTTFAPWSPPEEDLQNQQEFINQLMKAITLFFTTKA